MSNPQKMAWMIRIRSQIDSFIVYAPLPNINPDIVSMLSVFMMVVAFSFQDNLWGVFTFVLLSIVLDWLDGVIARKHNRMSRRGYWVDAVCDRASEGILAAAFFDPWFYLFSINLMLMYFSWQTKVNFFMPLRMIFLVVLLIKIFFGLDFGWI